MVCPRCGKRVKPKIDGTPGKHPTSLGPFVKGAALAEVIWGSALTPQHLPFYPSEAPRGLVTVPVVCQ